LAAALAKIFLMCIKDAGSCIGELAFMVEIARRNRLLPWYMGMAVIVVAVAYIGYQMFFVGCPAPTMVELIVLLIIPVVYLGLMYLTFISQE
jgi:hypothetical protein